MQDIKEKLFTENNLKYLLKNKIPEIFNDKYLEKIKDFNELTDFNDFFDKHQDLLDYDSDFYNDILSPIQKVLNEIYDEFDGISLDFDYFISNFNKDYELIHDSLRIEYEELVSKKRDEIDGNFITDVACGIFSVSESRGRQFYHRIYDDVSSDKLEKFKRELKYLVDSFFSYLYIKTEQVLFFYYNISNKKEGNLYIMTKYEFFVKNNLFNNKIIFDEITIKELNTIWVFYKHQEPIDKELVYSLYKKENIDNYILYVSKFYSLLKPVLKFGSLIKKIVDYTDYIEGMLNPLGLTGFECD